MTRTRRVADSYDCSIKRRKAVDGRQVLQFDFLETVLPEGEVGC